MSQDGPAEFWIVVGERVRRVWVKALATQPPDRPPLFGGVDEAGQTYDTLTDSALYPTRQAARSAAIDQCRTRLADIDHRLERARHEHAASVEQAIAELEAEEAAEATGRLASARRRSSRSRGSEETTVA